MCFCEEIHAPTHCTNTSDDKSVMFIVKRYNLCFNCLDNHHANECQSKRMCRPCDHSSLISASHNVGSEILTFIKSNTNQQFQFIPINLINDTENKENAR